MPEKKKHKFIKSFEAEFDKNKRYYKVFPLRNIKSIDTTDKNTKDKTSSKSLIKNGEAHFTAYANVFSPDRIDDITDANTFKKTIKDRNGVVPIYWMHSPYEPIGLGKVSTDDKGLRVDEESFIDVDTQRGMEVFSGMNKGYITELSIGYRIVKAHYELWEVNGKEKEFFKLDEVKLDEFSLLPMYMACHPDAKIEELKSMEFNMKVIEDLQEKVVELTNKIVDLEKKIITQEPGKSTSDNSEPGDHSDIDEESLKAIMDNLNKSHKILIGEN